MANVPVTKYEREHPYENIKTTVKVDMSLLFNDKTPNPMFEEMHKTIYSIFSMILGISVSIILFARVLTKDIINDVNITGEASGIYVVIYFCLQSKVCHDIILLEENRGMEECQEESESNRIYLILAGIGSNVSMLVYLISCQFDSKFAYHLAGVWLCIAMGLNLISAFQIKTRKNYIFFVTLGITYILALILILK